MKVSGYQIREALKRQELRRSALQLQAKDSLWKFTGETKSTPQEIMAKLEAAETAIATLQTLQDRYNLQTTVLGVPLTRAVKQVGAAGRLEKLWRELAMSSGNDVFHRGAVTERNKESEFAVKQISIDEAMKKAFEAATIAGNLRAAIAKANANEIEFEGLDPALFA